MNPADTPYGEVDIPLQADTTALQTSVTNLQAGIGMVLPTADPHVAGHLWANTGVVTVSAG